MAGDVDRLKPDEDESEDERMSEAEIDYNVMGTFPASDPPSWTLGIGRHRKPHTEFEGGEPSVNDPSHQNEVIPRS